jgi:UDP-2-acetamido-3-amino-2,3-dideoxy-glucuronate N-acetyltransferase
MKEVFIHNTAEVGYSIIGAGTKIWRFSHVGDKAEIGENCTIGQNVYVGPKVEVGSGCKIQNNVFIPEGVIIKNDVFIGPGVTFTNVKRPRAFVDRKSEFSLTIVKYGASIGASSTIICGIEIGRYSMIGAGSLVLKSVGDFQVVFGSPAKVMGIVSKDGDEITYKENAK